MPVTALQVTNTDNTSVLCGYQAFQKQPSTITASVFLKLSDWKHIEKAVAVLNGLYVRSSKASPSCF